jgi:hypothetical protein
LKKGAIWRIGSGVRIFRDNWLPRPGALKLHGRRESARRRWVSELIDPTTRSWNEGVVRECCLPIDAEEILAIKLPTRQCDDFVAWLPESNGMFLVRSAYRLGLQPTLDALSQGQSSGEPLGDRRIWKDVWKARVPQKMRIFAWKAATSTLAVKAGLQSVEGSQRMCIMPWFGVRSRGRFGMECDRSRTPGAPIGRAFQEILPRMVHATDWQLA